MPPLKICVQAVPDAVEEYLVATITEDIDSTTFAEVVISPENVDGDIVESVAPVATPAAKTRGRPSTSSETRADKFPSESPHESNEKSPSNKEVRSDGSAGSNLCLKKNKKIRMLVYD